MESPLIIHKQLSHIDKINDIAYTRLFENYLKYDLKGKDKLIEITSTDQESIIKKFSFGVPVPGMIYTFLYNIEKVLSTVMDKGVSKEFMDVAPIVFCTTYNIVTKSFSGINMNMLPNSERLKFLEEYYKFYKPFFENIEEKTENTKTLPIVNTNFIMRSMIGKTQELIKAFNKIQIANFNYGYRKYIIEKVRKFRMIEYEEWNYIPFYNPRDAFRKMNFKEIHRIYKQHIKDK